MFKEKTAIGTKAKRLLAMLILSVVAFGAVFMFTAQGGSEMQSASAATIKVTKSSQKIATDRLLDGKDANCKMQPCKHMVQKIFSSLDEAAIDWGKTYNAKSMVERKEYASTIYQIANGKYVYTLPDIGKVDEVYPSEGCMKDYINGDAVAHSHPMRAISLGTEEQLSGGDMGYAAWSDSVKLYVYVTTPEGKLKKAYPTNSEDYYYGFWYVNFGYLFDSNEITVSKDMPHDRRANGQVLQFKHWFGRKCGQCAQKLA